MKVEYFTPFTKMQGYNYRNNSSYKKGNPRPWPWAVAPNELSGESTPSTLLYCNNFHGSTWFRTDQYPVPAPSPQYGLGPPKGYTINQLSSLLTL